MVECGDCFSDSDISTHLALRRVSMPRTVLKRKIIFRMMSNTGTSLLSVTAVLLILCCSILPTRALDTGGGGDIEEVEGDGEGDDLEGDPFLTVTNTSVLEENTFNTTEHRGFLHGFVESLSVILVMYNII